MAEKIVDTIAKNYSIILKTAGGKNLSNYVNELRIINSIYSVWPQFIFVLNAPLIDILKADLFGHETLDMTIILNNEDGKNVDRINLKLLYLQANPKLTVMPIMSIADQSQSPMELRCIPLYAASFMGTFVNVVKEEKESPAQNPIEFLKSIFDNLQFSNYDIDEKGKNPDIIDQIVVPPVSLKRAIDYINEQFGFFKGPAFRYCDMYGRFHMWDLSCRIKGPKVMQIIQMPSSFEEEKSFDKVINSLISGIFYYTADAIDSNYFANSNILKYGYNHIYINHPETDLFCPQIMNVDDANEKYGVQASEARDFQYHKFLKCRNLYYHDSSGNDKSDVGLTNEISQSLKTTSKIKLILRRNVQITSKYDNSHPIFSVGEPVDFIPTSALYGKYRGKYILETSMFTISRLATANTSHTNWDGQCILTLTRSNHEKTILE